MRSLTEIENQNESFLKDRGIHFTKVLMTKNILSHHIFDATQTIGKFLKDEGIHDFDSQGFGEKTYITTHLLTFKDEKKSLLLSTKQPKEEISVCGLVLKFCQRLLPMTFT